MAKRFSGEVRLTISKRECYDDEYDVKVRAPGCSPHEGVAALQAGFASLHGDDAAYDQAALQYMRFCEDNDDLMGFVAHAAKDGDVFHVGRSKADRWPGGPSNTKTKKGR